MQGTLFATSFFVAIPISLFPVLLRTPVIFPPCSIFSAARFVAAALRPAREKIQSSLSLRRPVTRAQFPSLDTCAPPPSNVCRRVCPPSSTRVCVSRLRLALPPLPCGNTTRTRERERESTTRFLLAGIENPFLSFVSSTYLSFSSSSSAAVSDAPSSSSLLLLLLLLYRWRLHHAPS